MNNAPAFYPIYLFIHLYYIHTRTEFTYCIKQALWPRFVEARARGQPAHDMTAVPFDISGAGPAGGWSYAYSTTGPGMLGL